MNSRIIWLTCAGLLAIGIFGLLDSKIEFRNDRIMYFGFCVPIIYWIFDRLFKRISENIHNRDFILFMRYSDEINDGFGAKNPHVKESDKLFSFGLLIIVVVALLIGMKVV
ncbi:hypothetical protein JM81_1842 [Maribacter sp. MAR_2009_72]|nr:hypothetical protein JM81_1842 [Maribacter sp. MAR_2009_72]